MAGPIGLIAGNGLFPRLFAQAARARGHRVVAIGLHGDTDTSLEREVDVLHMVHLGQIGRMERIFVKEGVDRAVMAGGVGKLSSVVRARPDWRGMVLGRRLLSMNDDHFLRALADEFQQAGVRIEPSTLYTPELLAPAGVLSARGPTDDEQKDIAFGFGVAGVLGQADVGQTVVVERGRVLALEASEGTDATIARGGGYGRGHAVVVKRAKPGQDLRFDLPAVGVQTIAGMAKAGCQVLAVEAGKTLLLDAQAVIQAADRAGIALVSHPG